VVETKDKLENGTVPVVLIDILQLVLGKSHIYGEASNFNLPKIQINTGILKGNDLQTAKQTCLVAISSEHEMPTSTVTFDNPGVTICGEAQKCLNDLSEDVVEWLKPQL